MTPKDKLREILDRTGWFQEVVAEHIGVAQSSIARYLKNTEPNGATRDRIDALYNEVMGAEHAPRIALSGIAGEGEIVLPLTPDQAELVTAPPDVKPLTRAVRVVGNFLLPYMEDRSIFYYSIQQNPEELADKRCVLELSDGRVVVKTLRHGSAAGLWTLTSIASADIKDVAVKWAATIDWIKPA